MLSKQFALRHVSSEWNQNMAAFRGSTNDARYFVSVNKREIEVTHPMVSAIQHDLISSSAFWDRDTVKAAVTFIQIFPKHGEQ